MRKTLANHIFILLFQQPQTMISESAGDMARPFVMGKQFDQVAQALNGPLTQAQAIVGHNHGLGAEDTVMPGGLEAGRPSLLLHPFDQGDVIEQEGVVIPVRNKTVEVGWGFFVGIHPPPFFIRSVRRHTIPPALEHPLGKGKFRTAVLGFLDES